MSKCNEFVGKGFVSHPCRLDLGHDGPCFSIDNTASLEQRKRWESGAEARSVLAETQGPIRTAADRSEPGITQPHPSMKRGTVDDSVADELGSDVPSFQDGWAMGICGSCRSGDHFGCLQVENSDVGLSDLYESRECSCYSQLVDIHIPPLDGSQMKRPELLIGLCGYARSGKDTVGQILIKNFGFKRYALADHLKTLAYDLNPIVGARDGTGMTNYDKDFIYLREIVDRLGWDEAKVQLTEVRRILQRLGTEVFRNHVDGMFWVDHVMDQILPSDQVVVTDVRFINELQAIKGAGGFLVRVDRPSVAPANDHSSEHEWEDWQFDYVLNNNAHMKELIQNTESMLGSLLVKRLF